MKSLIWLSIGMTVAVAAIVAIGCLFISPAVAGGAFFITFAIEWVVMEPINRGLRLKNIKADAVTATKMIRLEEAVGKQSVILECEYCNTSNSVPIQLNSANGFICSSCGNSNTVVAQFTTVRSANSTGPFTPSDTSEIIDDIEDGEDKIVSDIEAKINGY